MLSAISRRLSAARLLWRRFGLDDCGSVAAMLVAVPVIAGAVAIGVETGGLYRIKRQMQSAADAAALAGSVDSINNKTSSITADALYEAQRNGFTDGVNGVAVAVHSPPQSGPNVGTQGAVEVIITKTQTFSLGAMVMSWVNRSNGGYANSGFTMRARSVAAQGSNTATSTNTQTASNTTAEGCIIALTPNNEQGISITSFNNFGSDCSIMSNGTATGTGSSASITMSSFNNATLASGDPSNPARIWTRGTFSKSSYNGFSADSILENQTSSIVDPYSSLGVPSPGACTYTNYVEAQTSVTLSPGTYCGGLSLNQKDNVYFTPGTYYIANGDLVIQTKLNVSCPLCGTSNGVTTGVTFVLTQTTGNISDIGGVSITSENNVTLNAPSTGTYAGVLFYQDRSVAAGSMLSTSKIFTIASLNNATLGGAVYIPQNRIDISTINNIGGNQSTGCTIWIGRYIKFSAYNNNYKGGCKTFGTIPAGITTTTTTTTSTTTTRNRVME
jgi:Putative Flp pilus-assembly TadE/G-like